MGVYRRTDAETYWMSLVIDGKRLRQNTGVQDRTVAGEIFAARQVQLARARWLGVPTPTPQHTVHELLTEYTAKVTPRKSPASQRRDPRGLGAIQEALGGLGLGPPEQQNRGGLFDGAIVRRDVGDGQQGARDSEIGLCARWTGSPKRKPDAWAAA